MASVRETLSRAEPIVMVSRLVSSVPMLIVLPASPVPRLMVFIPVSPVARLIVSASVSVPMLIVPVEPELSVRALVALDSIVPAAAKSRDSISPRSPPSLMVIDPSVPETLNSGELIRVPNVPVKLSPFVTVPADWVRLRRLVIVPPACVCCIRVLLVRVPDGLFDVNVATVSAAEVAERVSLRFAGDRLPTERVHQPC